MSKTSSHKKVIKSSPAFMVFQIVLNSLIISMIILDSDGGLSWLRLILCSVLVLCVIFWVVRLIIHFARKPLAIDSDKTSAGE